MLKRLFIAPQCGWGNRLRAIASARRACAAAGAECVVCWDWGKLGDYLDGLPSRTTAPPGGLNTLYTPGTIDLNGSGGATEIIVSTGREFDCQSDTPLDGWFPSPSIASADRARSFQLGDALGLHMRRGDNGAASADLNAQAFFDAARSASRLFLATDNAGIEAMMRERFPRLMAQTKSDVHAAVNGWRWPRARFDSVAAMEDWIDLLLLSECGTLFGSEKSSFFTAAKIYQSRRTGLAPASIVPSRHVPVPAIDPNSPELIHKRERCKPCPENRGLTLLTVKCGCNECRAKPLNTWLCPKGLP